MDFHYSVTFEFEMRPPLTHKGTLAASSGATCASRAVRAAQKALRPVGWTSVVCLAYRPPSAKAGSATEVAATTPRDEKTA